MIKVEASIVIQKPVPEVFAYTNDPAKNKAWQEGLVESKITSPGPIGVGTQMTEVIFSRSTISQMVWASVLSSM